ncbi:MAG: hypothetical protein M1449_04315, partial [Candidatus Thermoplasmatota archaeon]|nr:hypothetical protein [Candidatus Thermoplasmatota archaeon]
MSVWSIRLARVVLMVTASLLSAPGYGGGYGALTPSPLLTDFNVNYSLIDPAIPSSLLGSGTSYFSLY